MIVGFSRMFDEAGYATEFLVIGPVVASIVIKDSFGRS
jgi:hypothetical protein